MIVRFAMYLLILISFAVKAGDISTRLVKQQNGNWSVSFSSDDAIERFIFVRNPDLSRASKWQPNSEDVVIQRQDGIEIIAHRDGLRFKQASFDLVPEYFSLPKEYATFAPFSDGGLLIYMGRFFVCANSCDDSAQKWNFELIADKQDKIIVHGQIHQQRAQWYESAEGSKVYVGPAQPIETDQFVSIIDSELPESLKLAIAQDMPKLMAFFSDKLGSLNFRPAFFASYSTRGEARGYQGGTLPGQIFIHWNGQSALEKMDAKSTYFLFAHEVAHLFQRDRTLIEDSRQNWVHEGAADYFAAIASLAGDPSSKVLEEKVGWAQQHCTAGLAENRQFASAVKGNPRLHYSCGIMLFHHIAHWLKQTPDQGDLFAFWRQYIDHSQIQGRATIDVFLDVLQSYVPEPFYSQVRAFCLEPEIDAYTFFSLLNVK